MGVEGGEGEGEGGRVRWRRRRRRRNAGMRWGGLWVCNFSQEVEADENAERGRVHLVVWALKTSQSLEEILARAERTTVTHVVSFRGTPRRSSTNLILILYVELQLQANHTPPAEDAVVDINPSTSILPITFAPNGDRILQSICR